MKNKRLLYVLLPAVIVIWGLIVRRMWAAAHQEELPSKRGQVELAVGTPAKPERRPPSLLLTYADPFKRTSAPLPAEPLPTPSSTSSTFQVRTRSSTALNLTPLVPVKPAAAPINWPVVRYLGSIINQRANTKVGLVVIDNSEMLLKLGVSEKGITMTSVFPDSVRLLFQGQKKTFLRN